MGNGKQTANGKKILIVDDEPHVIKSLTFVLTKEGYDVSSADNGEDAMTKIRQSKPSLVFLDVMMPKKNGYEVCQEVKKDSGLRDIRVIMLTAKGQEADRQQGLEAGADEFMTKPFSPMGIVDKVKELLG
ncbi:Alkaline phosphatase synthesis transcriptional regulatory protein PhoP [subsurface metagenome]